MFYDTKNLDGNSFIPAEDYCEFDSAEDLLEKAYFFLRDEKEHMVIQIHGLFPWYGKFLGGGRYV